MKKLKGYDEDNLHNLHLDKDIKVANNKLYSPETCIFVTAEENYKQMLKTTQYNYKKFRAISPKGEIYYGTNQRIFAEEHGLSRTGIISVLKGRTSIHKGWKFEYV